ncbi:MAG: PAS domain S-box protein [SAR324 cluster bacterium]|nr:PAS domain S-box protein [SAR324 cluster bacterium]
MLDTSMEPLHIFSGQSDLHNPFETIVQNLQDGVVVMDRDGNVCFVNSAAKSLLNGDFESLRKTVFAQISAEDACLSDSKQVRHNGSIAMEVQISNIPWQGKMVMLMILHDTEQHRKLEEKYRDILNNTIDGIFQTTYEGQYIYINKALAHIYGYDSIEEMMIDLSDIERQLYVLPERRKEFQYLLKNQDIIIDFESQVYRRDGEIIWIKENSRAVYDKNSQFLYYEGTVENITKRKEAEENLRIVNRSADRFVPHRLIKLLGKKSITELQLNDFKQQQMSVMFLDIRDFTSLSEIMTPLETFLFLNSFLKKMGPIVRKNHGFIDKYIGDGIMALFDSATDALQAGLEMLGNLNSYNVGREKAGYPPVRIGIGINTGKLTLGVIGEEHRMDGTVIGDTVNVASRVEQLTKKYGVSLLISGSTFFALDTARFPCIRMVDRTRIRGKHKKVVVYEVFETDPPHLRSRKEMNMQLFEKGWMMYQKQKFQEAADLFELCLEAVPEDQVIQVYLKRCEQKIEESQLGRLQGLKIIP